MPLLAAVPPIHTTIASLLQARARLDPRAARRHPRAALHPSKPLRSRTHPNTSQYPRFTHTTHHITRHAPDSIPARRDLIHVPRYIISGPTKGAAFYDFIDDVLDESTLVVSESDMS